MPQTDTPSEQPDRFKGFPARPSDANFVPADGKQSSESRRKLWAIAAEHFKDDHWLE